MNISIMKNYDCYLFDADGTLIDTADMIYRCFLFSCKKFAGIDISRELVLAHIGLPLRAQMETYIGKLGDERYEEIVTAHMDYQLGIYKDHLRLFDGIAEVLKELKDAGKSLGVVTSRRHITTNLYLKEMGIHHYFDALVTPELTEKHKPDPEPVQKALDMLGQQPEQAIMVGDAGFDIECGSNAGTDTAFVAWSHNAIDSLDTKPTYVIKHVKDLLAGNMHSHEAPH